MAAVNVGGVTLDTTILDKLMVEVPLGASKIVETFGLKIASEAAQNAPVDTGALRNSVLSESHLEQPLLFIVQDGVEYGVFQEFGTSRIAAQPFMVPAIEANREPFQDALKALFI